MKLGRMTGPFTEEEMNRAVGGVTWVTSPVFVIQMAGEPGMPDKT
jgi:hypothetical protein